MDILSLSNYIIRQFSEQSPGGITPMKLQKLLYYVKVWTLVAERQLVSAEFKRWNYGPVNRDVYDYYRNYGGGKISSNELSIDSITQSEQELVDFIVENYISLDAFTLSSMTHTEEPWRRTNPNETISDELIVSYYSKQRFAKNFHPFDLLNSPFHPLDNYSFEIDMAEKDAEEISEYPSYQSYKDALKQAKQDFDEQWSDLLLF